MLIPTYYLLSKNWDIFATRYCILLIFNPNYFRGGQVTPKRQHIFKDEGFYNPSSFFVQNLSSITFLCILLYIN